MHRYVWIVGPLVFKFPRIMEIKLWKWMTTSIWLSGNTAVLNESGDKIADLKVKGVERLYRFFNIYFRRIKVEYQATGVMENWREALIYFRTRHRLLARLYLPLIIVNVYQYHVGVADLDGRSLSKKLYHHLGTGSLSVKCWHTFDHQDNFAYSQGAVKILDYGEKGFENLLTKYGDEVEQLLLSVAKN